MTKEEAIDILQEDIAINKHLIDTLPSAAAETFKNDILAYNMAIKALEQQPCTDWYDVPSDEMTLEQARQAVKDLRKKLAEDLINQRATTCRHGGHCEWVACDKCNHYEPDVLNQQPCEDCISRQAVIDMLNYGILENNIKELPSVTPKEKTGYWIGDKCSNCGNERAWYGDNPKFCPDCGLRMVKE